MEWLIYIGLGMLWQGLLILWVSGPPLALVKASAKTEAGTTNAFWHFWLKQYRYVGLSLTLGGGGLTLAGAWLQ